MDDEVTVVEQNSIEDTTMDEETTMDSSIAISKKRTLRATNVVSGVRSAKGTVMINLGGILGFIILNVTDLIMGVSATLSSWGTSAKGVPVLGGAIGFLLDTVLSSVFSIIGIVIRIPCYVAIGAAIILDVILLLRLLKMLISKIKDALRKRKSTRMKLRRNARKSTRMNANVSGHVEPEKPVSINVTVCNQTSPMQSAEQSQVQPLAPNESSAASAITKEVKEMEKLDEF